MAMLGWPIKSKEQKKQGEGDEQDVVESPVGLDNGIISVIDKKLYNQSCEDGETEGRASQNFPQMIFKSQKGHSVL